MCEGKGMEKDFNMQEKFRVNYILFSNLFYYICSMIKIDKEPKISGWKKRKVKYPFRDMKVDDSFFVASKDIKSKRRPIDVVAGAVYAWVKSNKSDRKFSCRTVDNGVRVWRIK